MTAKSPLRKKIKINTPNQNKEKITSNCNQIKAHAYKPLSSLTSPEHETYPGVAEIFNFSSFFLSQQI